jgi:tRNA modification GTPase
VALASAPGPGRRGILRLSGPRARELVAARLTLPGPWPPPRSAVRGRFDDGRGRQPALLLWFEGPQSYTREDLCELHLPGSPPLLEAALRRLLADGARRAAPGEFTRRAFLSGRLDLTRAEGVLELVAARNEAERRAAVELLGGGLGRRLAQLRRELDELRALCEASLDFDEADTGHVPTAELERAAAEVARGLRAAAAVESARAPQRGWPRVVLVGEPNAGKSSLFNALGGGQHLAPALVSSQPGTTRDPLVAELHWHGQDLQLWDLAGLGGAGPADELDLRARQLAERWLASADVLLVVVDACSADAERLGLLASNLVEGPPRWLVWNQLDRSAAQPVPSRTVLAALGCTDWVGTSARDGRGLGDLVRGVAERLAARPPVGALSRELAEVHARGLAAAVEALEEGRARLAAQGELDLVAGDLRRAVLALDALAGHSSPEDLLDLIFARFCLGK